MELELRAHLRVLSENDYFALSVKADKVVETLRQEMAPITDPKEFDRRCDETPERKAHLEAVSEFGKTQARIGELEQAILEELAIEHSHNKKAQNALRLLQKAENAESFLRILTRLRSSSAPGEGDNYSIVGDLENLAAQIGAEIQPHLGSEALAPTDPLESQQYEAALDRWDSPGTTLEDKLRYVRLAQCRERLIPLVARAHATFLQWEASSPSVKAYRQQFEQLPLSADPASVAWADVRPQLSTAIHLLQDAVHRCRPSATPARGTGTGKKKASSNELAKVIATIQALQREGRSHQEICEQLASAPRPPTVKWKHLSWSDAFRDRRYSDSVKTWISKHLHRPVISISQK